MTSCAATATSDDQPVVPERVDPATMSASELMGLFGQLRAAVTDYVCQLRAAGLRPDEVLPLVQRLVQQAEGDEQSPDELGVLMGQVVRWSLEAYHAAPPPHAAPRAD